MADGCRVDNDLLGMAGFRDYTNTCCSSRTTQYMVELRAGAVDDKDFNHG